MTRVIAVKFLNRESYGFKVNLESICTSEFFKKTEIKKAALASVISAFSKVTSAN